jgi:hypothetical protein
MLTYYFCVADKVYFIISDRSTAGGGPAVWAELDQAPLHDDFLLLQSCVLDPEVIILDQAFSGSFRSGPY